jgi:hypothetical protein
MTKTGPWIKIIQSKILLNGKSDLVNTSNGAATMTGNTSRNHVSRSVGSKADITRASIQIHTTSQTSLDVAMRTFSSFKRTPV